MITISARPRRVDFWGQHEILWIPIIVGEHERVELELCGSQRDALRLATAFRDLVEAHGWLVARDMERRANAPSPARIAAWPAGQS
jgi:hypothetical protein